MPFLRLNGMNTSLWIALIVLTGLIIVGIKDRSQKNHTLRHNVPILAWVRYLAEKIAPEFRQYFFASNREEKPFNRKERDDIYKASKGESTEYGFGTDADITKPDHIFFTPGLFPGTTKTDAKYSIAPKKIIGPQRRKPYQQESVVNFSGVSLGAHSPEAIESYNRGAYIAGCHQNTGEGGFSDYHSKVPAKVILQFGTGYFGARTPEGLFDFEKLKVLVDNNPNIVAIEFKISQGAKPLKRSVFPHTKITDEIRKVRGLSLTEDAISPANHKMFSNPDEMLDFIEKVAEVSGLPVGIKCAPGKEEVWHEVCKLIIETNRTFDYIQIDGGEGGTGSASESYASHVGIPFMPGFAMIYKVFQQYNLTDKMFFVGSAKLGFSHKACLAFAMGCDSISVVREAMIAIGCLQTQHCSQGGSIINGGCPVGIATQDPASRSGLDPVIKGLRAAKYIINLRKEIIEITNSSGYSHPSELNTKDVMMNAIDGKNLISLKDVFGYQKGQFSSQTNHNIIGLPVSNN